MPARQPFTALCRLLSHGPGSGRADLHLHTTHSDGQYTPAQIVELARRSGLSAIALTDHDTLSGLPEAHAAAAGSSLEIIDGVEITCEHRGKELHLLAYYVRPDDALLAALERLCRHRAERFRDMIDRLRTCGVSLEEADIPAATAPGSLGRRYLAELLVRAGRVGSVREAFARYLKDNGRVAVPKVRLPVAYAIALVRSAGGVASWAHPSHDCTRESLAELGGAGLGAVEAEYPTIRLSRSRELRGWAQELGLAVTGGSDCHGPDQPRRTVGACGISTAELTVLRQMASQGRDPAETEDDHVPS
jgi:predicted metal-dependent phosphoesterase TrpH